MAGFEGVEGVVIGIILGTLAAIVYCLRILVLLERRIARIDLNLDKIARQILEEELRIEKEELKIEKLLKGKIREKKKSKK